MAVDNFYFRGSLNPKDLIDSYKYVLEYRKANPRIFCSRRYNNFLR